MTASSITIMARDGDWTGVFTMRPDGHLSGGMKRGGVYANANKDVAASEVARAFALAELPPDVPAGPRGARDGVVMLTINTERGKRQFAWATGTRPADARLLALVEAVEHVRDHVLGG